MQKILSYAYDIVLFTINKYFSLTEALNIERVLTVHGNPITHILAELVFYFLIVLWFKFLLGKRTLLFRMYLCQKVHFEKKLSLYCHAIVMIVGLL